MSRTRIFLRAALQISAALAICITLGGLASAQHLEFTNFNVPGAIETFAEGIGVNGTVFGFYLDGSRRLHGFTRDPQGTITTYDAPGAGRGAGQGTGINGVNEAGEIVGSYTDSGYHTHGFMYSHDVYVPINVPDAPETFPNSINAAGTIAGDFTDAAGKLHGFEWNRQGFKAFFNAPGATNTSVSAINDAGVITGTGTNAAGLQFAWVRADGEFIDLSFISSAGTISAGINNAGVVTGTALNKVGSFSGEGFVSNPPYTPETTVIFSVPGAKRTNPAAINNEGVIAGTFNTTAGNRGFLFNSVNDHLLVANDPAGSRGTVMTGIDPHRVAAGYYSDSNGTHGFTATIVP